MDEIGIYIDGCLNWKHWRREYLGLDLRLAKTASKE
jgi:hypothetical protein